MGIKEKLIGALSVILAVALIFGLFAVMAGSEKSEPENPITEHTDKLNIETLSGTDEMLSSDEETPDEPEEPEEEPPENEPEDEPEEDEPEEEQEIEELPLPEDIGGEVEDNENTDDTSGVDGDGEGPGDDDGDGENEPDIATNLFNGVITKAELPDGVLDFYAYPAREADSRYVKAVLNNSSTPINGRVLRSADGENYEAELKINEVNIFTLYLKDKATDENISYVRYRISYETEKANEDNPEVGKYPPFITTNLDDFTGNMETQDFVFWVSARTNPERKAIYSNQIEVRLNGKVIQKQTGDSRPEYELHFEPPNVGDYATYTVEVLAWDGQGNSTYKIYTLNYHTVSEGDYLGEVTMVLDATTVGLGVLDTATYEIVQGDTAAGLVIKFLEEYGYEAVYDGNANIGFYLREIYRGDMCRRAKVPEKLWELILRDGITLGNEADRDSLGEHDYTMGAGWMYSINGQVYPGRALSDYKLSGGDTIYIRFTLSYGKDIGGFDATGQGHGALSSYCGVWLSGSYQPLSHNHEESDRLEPTASADGYIEYTCTKCGDSYKETLPKTGTNEPEPPDEPDPEEPDEPENPDTPEPEEPVTLEEPDNPGGEEGGENRGETVTPQGE